MNFIDYLTTNMSQIIFLTQQHVEVVLISVGVAALIGVGLGFLAESHPALRGASLAVTGTFLTLPSYAIFALLIPLLGLGAGPTLVGLIIYGIFPILQNTITGIEGVDADVIDAARGLGMGQRLRVLTVILPIAWPVILSGIRVSTTILVAIAAIAAAVDGPGLGKLIFIGLARMGGANALNQVLTGIVGVVIVATVLELFFMLIAKLTTPRGLHV